MPRGSASEVSSVLTAEASILQAKRRSPALSDMRAVAGLLATAVSLAGVGAAPQTAFGQVADGAISRDGIVVTAPTGGSMRAPARPLAWDGLAPADAR